MHTSVPEESAVCVSVVIPTRNRPDMIGQAVASVLANDYPAFDLTVVDQSPNNATADILRPFIERDPRLHYLHLDRAGVAHATNTGIRSSMAEILAFTDDDCIVPSNWLTSIVAAFATEDDGDLLYGTVLQPSGTEAQQGITPHLDIRRPEKLGRRGGFRLIGMGANFAARRRALDAIGGFDELLGPGTWLHSSQDFDLVYRAYRAGLTILLRPEVRVVHYGTRTLTEWPERIREYGIGDGAFYWKHVRCGDFFALWLLASQLFNHVVRTAGKRVIRGRRSPFDLTYGYSVLVGIRASLNFKIDRFNRLYVRR